MLRNGNSWLKMGVSFAAHTQYAYIMEVTPRPRVKSYSKLELYLRVVIRYSNARYGWVGAADYEDRQARQRDGQRPDTELDHSLERHLEMLDNVGSDQGPNDARRNHDGSCALRG